MRERILTAVRCKPARADDLAGRFGAEEGEVLAMLFQLRREGRVRQVSKSPVWHWDEDFVCPDCDLCWPAIRRAVSQRRCTGCYALARVQPVKPEHQATPSYVVTRFGPTDVDRHFAGRLAAEWARKPMGVSA